MLIQSKLKLDLEHSCNCMGLFVKYYTIFRREEKNNIFTMAILNLFHITLILISIKFKMIFFRFLFFFSFSFFFHQFRKFENEHRWRETERMEPSSLSQGDIDETDHHESPIQLQCLASTPNLKNCWLCQSSNILNNSVPWHCLNFKCVSVVASIYNNTIQ